MSKADFFNRKRPDLERITLELPTFGTVVLERMGTDAVMHHQAISNEMWERYGPTSDICFPMVDDKPVTLTYNWCATAAGLLVMQKQDEPYSFEEIIAGSLTDEDEYNQLVNAANLLNVSVSKKKAEPDLEVLSLGTLDEVSA